MKNRVVKHFEHLPTTPQARPAPSADRRSAFAAVVRAEARAAARVDDAVAGGGGSTAWRLAVRIEVEAAVVGTLLRDETNAATAGRRM